MNKTARLIVINSKALLYSHFCKDYFNKPLTTNSSYET